jgi:adenylate cyclase
MKRPARPSFETLLTSTFVLIGVIWGGFLGVRHVAGIGPSLDRLENLTIDWRFSLFGAQPPPRGVVIVAVDDESVREMGGYPLPRNVLARIVRELAVHDPQAVAIDMLFLDTGKPDADLELADAFRSTKSIIATMGTFDPSANRDDVRVQAGELAGVPIASNILWPIAALRDAARSGLVNLATDRAGVPRYVPMVFRTGQSIVPSFALAASSAALNVEPVLGPGTLKLAARAIAMDLGYHLPIRYYGPRGSFRQISALRVLRRELAPDDVRGQVMVLGATATALGDTFATPFDEVVSGAEIFATAISNLLAGDGLVRTKFIRKIDAAAGIVLATLGVLLLSMHRTALGNVLATLVFLLWTASTVVAFFLGYWLSIAVPLAAALPVTMSYGTLRVAYDQYLSRRLRSDKVALIKFQSPRLVEQILNNPRFLEKPVRQDVAVVFLDLSRFTAVTEILGPERTRDLLADFHALVERDADAHDGFVVGFSGDGAMIVFGVPEPKPDDAARALLAIIQLRNSVTAWIGALGPVARERLSARIGGHVGPVVVSRLGPAHHQHVTATGDTVNVTSRLLEVAKQQRASVVISEDLYTAAKSSASSFAPIMTASVTDVGIRGRTQGLRIRVWH